MNQTNRQPEREPQLPKGMGAPATRAFVAAGFTSVEQFSGASQSALLKLHGVGPKAIRIIEQTLADRNLPPLTP